MEFVRTHSMLSQLCVCRSAGCDPGYSVHGRASVIALALVTVAEPLLAILFAASFLLNVDSQTLEGFGLRHTPVPVIPRYSAR